MATVTYRGQVEELQGAPFDVPDSVVKAGQAASWIESQHREQQAREAAAAEAERRQQELLAARLEQQRAASNAADVVPPPSRDELRQELRGELDQLSQSVIAAGAAIAGRGEAEAAARAEWEGRHEQLLAQQEQTAAAAAEQVVQAQATTEATVQQVSAELSEHRARVAELERELRTVVSGLVGPQGERGERGLAGAGFAYVDADPTRIEQGSLGKRLFGRAVVPGDHLLQRTTDSLKVWRSADGRTWKQVDEIVNKQELVSQSLQVSDRSQNIVGTTVVTNVMAPARGGGADAPLVSALTAGGSVALFESLEPAKRGHVSKAFTALVAFEGVTGAAAGQVVSLQITGVVKAGTTFATTEYSLLSASPGFEDQLFPTFSLQLSAASDPAVTVNTLKVFLAVTGAFADAKVSGSITWAEEV